MAMVVGTGECIDGARLSWCGTRIVFRDPCDPCMALLRAEGYDVSYEPVAVAA
jgi:hypothetical protein